MADHIVTDPNGRKRIVNCCTRCGKITEGVHTCTPNPVIERLTAELADCRKALEVRNKQLGVVCMKHDLVHSLACGICLTETRDLAELAEQRRVELGECRKDAERLDWLLCRVSGKEYRRIGIEYSAGCLRSDIDAAMEAKP